MKFRVSQCVETLIAQTYLLEFAHVGGEARIGELLTVKEPANSRQPIYPLLPECHGHKVEIGVACMVAFRSAKVRS
jgi:hypothetical protein